MSDNYRTQIEPLLERIGTQNSDMASALLAMANKMGAFETPLSISAIVHETRLGHIGAYMSAGDPIYINESGTVTGSIGDSTGITAVTVTKDTFIDRVLMTGTYEFAFDGAAWHFEGDPVTLSDFGITVTGTATEGDHVVVRYAATKAIYDVSGVDEENAVNPTVTHVLSALRRNCHSNITFDPPQYLFAVTADTLSALEIEGNTLPAGTYNVTLDHGAYNGGTGEDSTYQITTTVAIPIGGGIRHSKMGESQTTYSKTNITSGTWITYGADRLTTLETGLACTEGSSGTSLGTATCSNPQYKSGSGINFTQRQRYGSGRWSTSYIRQRLNSRDATFVFAPATIWSRPESGSAEGFIHSLEPEVRENLVKIKKRYALSIADGYGYEDIEDYVTLPTMLDAYGSQNNSISEGPVNASGTVTRTVAKSLFKDILKETADKIKTLSGAARYWWLSSTNPSYAYYERYVFTSGALGSNNANGSFGAVPELHFG